MKTENNKLVFIKNSVADLHSSELALVIGGTMTINPSITIGIGNLTKQITCGGGEDTCVTR